MVRSVASAVASNQESIDSPSSGFTCSGNRRAFDSHFGSYFDKIFEPTTLTAA